MMLLPRSTPSSRRNAGLLLAAAIGAGALPPLRQTPAIQAAGLVVLGASATMLLSRAARAPSVNNGPPAGFGACVPLVIVSVLIGAASWAGLLVPPGGDMTPVFASTGVLCVIISLAAITPRPRGRRGLWSPDDSASLSPALLGTGFGADGAPLDVGDGHSASGSDAAHSGADGYSSDAGGD